MVLNSSSTIEATVARVAKAGTVDSVDKVSTVARYDRVSTWTTVALVVIVDMMPLDTKVFILPTVVLMD